MTEIILCNQPLNSGFLENHCGASSEDIIGVGCANPSMLNPYTPYMIEQNPTAIDYGVISQLTSLRGSCDFTNLSLSLGGDNASALADVTAKLHEYNIGLLGASTSVYAHRIGGFAGSVMNYQTAILEYRKAIESNSVTRSMTRHRAHDAYDKLQRNFSLEMASVKAINARASKNSPLTNFTKAKNIARSSRNVAKLHVANQIQASNLVKLSKHAKFLGTGLAVIDFGSRVGNIHNSYQASGNWEREMFIESSSFASSAFSGMLAVKAGGAALTFLMVVTPVGWLGLIIGGVAVAGVAAATAITVNNYTKDKAGGLYDDIMQLISAK